MMPFVCKTTARGRRSRLRRGGVLPLLGALLCTAFPTVLQAEQTLPFTTYLAQVVESNLELLAQRYAVPIAEAQVAVARVFPDPVITGGISQIDVSGQEAPFMSTLGITLPIEVGGKRAARVAAAQADVAVTQSELADALRKLRGDAATAYVDALYARLVHDRKQRSFASLQRLTAVNEQRVRSGDIGEVALIQSRVEAERYHGEVVAAEAQVRTADLALRLFMGRSAPPREALLSLQGDLRTSPSPRDFSLSDLLVRVERDRPDVRARQQGVQAAQRRTALAGRNRWVDVTLNVSWQRSLYSDPFASPQYDALTATLSVPVPFSRVYRGELLAAQSTAAQADLLAQAARLRAENEAQAALVRYRASVQQLGLYTQGLLADADRVLTATLFTYQRGSATLLEVLNAQRTVDDVYLAYYAALADHARNLIAVEQSAALWDIAF